ncbi:MAG TPA: hypothetical protein VKZ63_07055 [Kofleriaceae bacterium]|nr:hypothetical protein [Kofleriaceae bacterium]
MRAAPGLGDRELDSAIALVRRQIDLGLARQLRSSPGGSAPPGAPDPE